LQCSQDSISRSAWRRVPARIRTTFCCSGVGSKKSRGIADGFYHRGVGCAFNRAFRSIKGSGPQVLASTNNASRWRRGRASVAELERNLIKERVYMGISRARKKGKQLGRPKRVFDKEKAQTMVLTMSVRQAARQLGVSRGVLERALSASDSSFR
jgi:hypothetical protein